MQIRRLQPIAAGDGHPGILERLDQRADHVTGGGAGRIEHDHDPARRAPQACSHGVPGREGLGGMDDLVGRAADLRAARGHDHDLPACGCELRQALEQRPRVRATGGHDDADGHPGGIAGARGDRVRRAMVDPSLGHEIRRERRPQGEPRALVHDRPAGRLDACLQLVGTREIPLAPRASSRLCERHDLGGC